MFNLEDFTKYIRNKHGQDITFEPAVELQKVVDSFSCDYFLFLEHSSVLMYYYMFAFKSHGIHTYTPIFTMTFAGQIKEGMRHFTYVECNSTSGRVFIFFSKDKTQEVYDSIVRIEKLKAFL